MSLSKRYLRNIKENLSFYISATVLTIITIFFYLLFSIAGNAILDFSEEFFARNKVEDAHFTTYIQLSDEDIADLEERFDAEIEAQRYINIETDGVTARVFEKTEKIDLYEITEGRDVSADDEIIMSEGYAVKNEINIGDKVKIGDKEYEIVGFMQRPDYLYMLENEEDSYKNITTFYLCYMSENEFSSLNADGAQYLVRYGENSDTTAFRKAVQADWYMRSYIAAEENNRILMVDQQAYMFVYMAYILLVIMPVVAMTLVSVILSRKVKSEQKIIGTLSALGYKKSKLMLHYAGFAVLPGLLGGTITTAAAAIFKQSIAEVGLQDYEPMRVTGRLHALDAVLAIAVPTLLYVAAALLSVRRLLKKDTVTLLNGNADSKKRLRKIFCNTKMNWKKKLAARTILGNPMRSFVILLGIFIGCYIMLLGMGFFDSINNMGTVAADTLGSFEHEYILNELMDENIYGGETLLVSTAEDENGASLSVIGADSDSSYLSLNDESGSRVDLNDGYYITSLVEYTLGCHEGDVITVKNPLTLEEFTFTVKGVIHNNVQKAIYTSKPLAADLTGLDESKFNCIISGEKLPIPEGKIAQEVLRTDITDQTKAMTEQMDFLLQMIIGLGAITCVAAIYVAVNMLITESRSNISMLKVLGYGDKQTDRVILSTHHIMLPLGIALSIPAVYATMQFFFKLLVDYGVILVDANIDFSSFVLAIGMTCICYFGSLWLLRRKVKRVDMVECLKDNRE